MSSFSAEKQLHAWANGQFTGKYDRSAKDIIKVVATGFLFMGGIVREAMGGGTGQASTVGIDLGQVGDGDQSAVPDDSTDEGVEGGEDSPNSEEKRGPGRPKKNN